MIRGTNWMRALHLLVLLLAGTAGACGGDDDAPGDGDADADADSDGDGDADGDADAEDEVVAPFLETARHFVGEGKVPGIAIAIVQHGAIHIGTLGVRRESSDDPVTAHTLFRGGTATTVTGTAILEQGLDLEAPLQTWVPELEVREGPWGTAADVTLQQAMTDTSGLEIDPTFPGVPDDCAGRSLEGFYEANMPLWPLLFEPGRVSYTSGAGMTLAGLALERAAGRPFDDVVQSLVLDPAGMTDATFDTDAPDREYATGHDMGPVDSVYDCRLLDPVDFYTSVHDLAALASWLLRRPEVLEASAASPYTHSLAHATSGYGLWVDTSMPGALTYFTDRMGTAPQSNLFMIIPEHDLAAVFLTNATLLASFDVLLTLMRQVFEDLAGVTPWQVHDSLPRERWGEYVGTYSDPLAADEWPTTVEVTQDSPTGELAISIDGEGPWPLAFRDIDGQDFRDVFIFESDYRGFVRFWRNAEDVVDIVQLDLFFPVFHRT